MEHEDWFLRTRAINALVPIATHPDHYRAIMPPMFRTIAAFTTDQAFAPVGALRNQLARASEPVKAYALEQLLDAYATIPEVMRFPGGRVMANGAPIVRDRVASMIRVLPGGEERLAALTE